MRTGFALVSALALVAVTATGAVGQGPERSDPRTAPRTWMDIEQHVTLSPDLQRLFLNGTVRVHAINATREAALVCGDVCTAQDIRSTYQAASPEQRDVLVTMLTGYAERKAFRSLAEMAGSPDEVAVTARVVPASLKAAPTPSPFSPTVDVRLFATAPTRLASQPGIEPAQVVSLFAMGARADVPVSSRAEPGQNLTLVFDVPAPLAAIGPGHGALGANNTTVTWSVDNWDRRAPQDILDAVRLARPDVVVPAAPRASLDIVLDLSDADGHLRGLLTGGAYATVDARLVFEATLEALALPSPPPPGVELPALSADAVRLALGSGLVEPAVLDAREANARRLVGQFVTEQLGQDAPVEGGWVNQTVTPGLRGDPPGTGGPLRLRLTANLTFVIPQAQPGAAGADGGASALTVSTVPLTTLTLPEVPALGPHETRLLVVLPPGVSLSYQNATGVDVVRLRTDEGHQAVLFTANETAGGPSQVQGASLEVEHPAVWHLFWPLVVLLAVVLVASPVAGAVWWRQRRP